MNMTLPISRTTLANSAISGFSEAVNHSDSSKPTRAWSSPRLPSGVPVFISRLTLSQQAVDRLYEAGKIERLGDVAVRLACSKKALAIPLHDRGSRKEYWNVTGLWIVFEKTRDPISVYTLAVVEGVLEPNVHDDQINRPLLGDAKDLVNVLGDYDRETVPS